MFAVALKGLRARKMRAFSTGLAVLLGVAFVSGTYILTDTINRSFDDIFDTALANTDVVISPKEIVAQEAVEPPPFPESVIDQVRTVDGVEKAEGGIFSIVRITNEKGGTLGADFAPQFVNSNSSEPFDAFTYEEGRAPETTAEAAIDASNAEKEDIGIGDTIGVVGDGPLSRYEVVGINKLGDTATGGSSTVTLTLPEAQRAAGKVGKLDAISVAGDGSVSDAELRKRIDAALPDTLQVETGAASAERQTDEIGDDLSFIQIALLVFSGISLIVGAFLIFNTFSITVAQRIREFGMLRTLGASRRQVLTSVLAEAGVIGVVASVLGLFAGFGMAQAINGLLKAFGIDLPNTGTVFATRTAVVALALGIVLTLIAALSPALRATRISPMAALREAALPGEDRRGRVTTVMAALLGLLGLVLLCYSLFGNIESSGSAAGLMGGGMALLLFAASLISPRLVKPLASIAGKPIERLRGLPGRLARENAMRKPGRTATTAAALMIGLALVVFVTVFAAGINKSIAATIDKNFQGELTIQNVDGFSPVPQSIERDVAPVDGVGEVSSLRFAEGALDGDTNKRERISAVDPRDITDVFNFEWENGSDSTIQSLTSGDMIIDEAFAESDDHKVGDSISFLTPTGETVSYKVVGTVKDRTDFLGSAVISHDALARDFGERRASYVYVGLAPGADSKQVEDRVTKLVKERYPSAKALNNEELKDDQEEQIGGLVSLVYALLSLAVIVSIFGIVNTLALSIHERTRELGMLRAVGMSRRQVRRVIRYEAVITALIGAILGMVLGTLFAALISRPLADEGFELAYPVVTLFILLVLAALAGVLAAIGPARRASKLDVLEALAYE